MKPPADGEAFIWRGRRRSAGTNRDGRTVARIEYELPDGSFTTRAPNGGPSRTTTQEKQAMLDMLRPVRR